MPRVKTFDEQDAVERAMQLFWEKGYAATSLSDLTAHLGIGKGSFYATFESKEHLFNQCIALYTVQSLPFLDQELLRTDLDFPMALKTLLEAYVEGLINDPKHKGCFMANSCSLADDQHPRIEQQINAHYQRIEQALADAMEQNHVEKAKARSIASVIITFLIGASQQSKVNQDRSSYQATIDHVIGMLKS
jgi:TetR/AcrR family transcriptional repressor of nem operon